MKTAPDRWLAALLGGVLAAPASAAAQEDVDELARKVSNPASYMISVPIHTDIDFADSADGETERALLDIEPVLPFRLNESWNLISHTDFPLGYVNAPGEGAVFGLGDVAQTLSFTPAGRRPFIWAAGLQASLPTATSRELGSGKFSLGPSILLLRQTTALTAAFRRAISGRSPGVTTATASASPSCIRSSPGTSAAGARSRPISTPPMTGEPKNGTRRSGLPFPRSRGWAAR